MKKTNIILAIMMLIASMSSAQQGFTSVAVQTMKKQTAISFTLPSEANTMNFRIEASNDGIDYKIVGVLPSKGNSVLPRSYSYPLFNKGYKYYRVGRVGMNGILAYSDIVMLNTINDKPETSLPGQAGSILATNTNASGR